jgi:predicted permease
LLDVLAVTAPVFLVIALGYGAVRIGLFSKDEVRPMGRLVISVALPALLFLSLASQPLATIANPLYLAAYGLGSLVMILAGRAVFRWRGHSPAAASILALGVAGSNSAFIGLPVTLQFFGPIASVAIALVMLVENLLTLPLTFALAEWGEGGDHGHWQRLRGSLASLLRNPLLIAIVAGTGIAILELPLPKPLFTTLDLLARVSTGLALFTIGGMLVGVRARAMAGDVGIFTIGKLVVHPLVVAAFVLLLLPDDPLGRIAIVIAACPMLSMLPIFAQRHHAEDVASAALVVVTAVSFVSLTVLLWLVQLT